MHRDVSKHNKHSGEHCKADHIAPQSKSIDAKCTQNRCSRHLDVEAILVVNESEISDLVDAQGFKAVMKDGELQVISTIGSRHL